METPVIEKPTAIGSGLGVLAGLVATTVTVGSSPTATITCLVGLGFLLIGLVAPRPGLISVGAVGLVLGVLLAGLAGSPAHAVGIGLVGAIVAWDVSHNSLSHGRQVGRDAVSPAPEAVHAGASAGIGILAMMVGYAIFTFAAAGQPATAVALFTVGAMLLVLAID